MNLEETLKKVKAASRRLAVLHDEEVNKVLKNLAKLLEENSEKILEVNADDLKKIEKDNPIYDRVLLTEKRITEMAASVREIAGYDSPIDIVLEEKTLGNGLNLKKVSVPLGVVGVIFEARPNVIIDIFALCFKSKNACVLKGGSDCEKSNEILISLIKEALGKHVDVAELLPNDREVVGEFLKADKHVDVLIPRGSQSLIDFVRENSKIPTIETGAGVVHIFFDESGDLEKGKKIIFNAKTQRPSVCNAMDTLLIHRKRLKDLPELCGDLQKNGVEIYADEEAFGVLKDVKKAEKENFGCEHLSLKMSIKTVGGVDEAIDHINTYGSRHSEAIITENEVNAEEFLKLVDAAAVYVNASTRFTDGAVFGLGAEVGISTQKLHARGPMGIKELTSYKWEVIGDGQVR